MRTILINKQYSTLLLITFYCMALLLLRVYITKNIYYLFLIWNLFLASIPYAIMRYLKANSALQKSYIIIIPLFIWILFLPNSFYIITDFIHINHSEEYLKWLDTILISCSSILGFAFGIISLNDFEKIVTQKKYLKVIIPLICFLCGFGIYLGRVKRYNSWNILNNPKELFTDLMNFLSSADVLLFSLLFGSFIYMIHLAYRQLIN